MSPIPVYQTHNVEDRALWIKLSGRMDDIDDKRGEPRNEVTKMMT